MRWNIVGSFVAVLLAPSAALSSTTFPPVLVDAWGLERLPPSGGSKGCLLCHSTDLGVTVTTPFGLAVDAAGTAKRDVNSFVRALNSLSASDADSDDDGVSDYRELALDGTDPNDSGDHVEPEPGNGGAAGAGGAGEPAESGGQGGSGEPAKPPDFVLPQLPRLPEHGCSFHDGVTGSPYVVLCALTLVSVALRRRNYTSSRRRVVQR